MSGFRWSCIDCGTTGEFGSCNQAVCTRRGLAVVKGVAKCCNCARVKGWKGFADCGCEQCHIRARIEFPPARVQHENAVLCVDPPMSCLPPITWTLCRQPWLNRLSCEEAATQYNDATIRLALFEFDLALFCTPLRPQGWPFSAYKVMPESLQPPIISPMPDDEWFNAEALTAARQAAADPSCVTALLSTRKNFLREKVARIVSGVVDNGLDEALLMPSLNKWSREAPQQATTVSRIGRSQNIRAVNYKVQAEQFKVHALLALLDRAPHVKTVEMWVANQSTADMLAAAARARGIEAEVHTVVSDPHEMYQKGALGAYARPSIDTSREKTKVKILPRNADARCRSSSLPSTQQSTDVFPCDTPVNRAGASKSGWRWGEYYGTRIRRVNGSGSAIGWQRLERTPSSQLSQLFSFAMCL